MDSIKTEGDLDALRRQASAWAVIIAWAQTGLFDLLKDGEPVIAEELPIHGNALRNTAPILAHLGTLNPTEAPLGRCLRALEVSWHLGRSPPLNPPAPSMTFPVFIPCLSMVVPFVIEMVDPRSRAAVLCERIGNEHESLWTCCTGAPPNPRPNSLEFWFLGRPVAEHWISGEVMAGTDTNSPSRAIRSPYSTEISAVKSRVNATAMKSSPAPVTSWSMTWAAPIT